MRSRVKQHILLWYNNWGAKQRYGCVFLERLPKFPMLQKTLKNCDRKNMSPKEDENYRGERRVGYHVKTNKKISWLRVWRREGGEGRSIWVHVTLPSDMRQIHMTYFCLQALVLCNFVWGLSLACKRRWLYRRALMTGWKKKFELNYNKWRFIHLCFDHWRIFTIQRKLALKRSKESQLKWGKRTDIFSATLWWCWKEWSCWIDVTTHFLSTYPYFPVQPCQAQWQLSVSPSVHNQTFRTY